MAEAAGPAAEGSATATAGATAGAMAGAMAGATTAGERVAVFRALGLGELLCATPALRALRRGRPDAHVALVGLPWARSLAERLATVDEFIAFPGRPGSPAPPGECSARLSAWLAGMRQRRFDLALQMHGGAESDNDLAAACGAARLGAFVPAGADVGQARGLHVAVPWPEHGRESERLLALTDALALPRRGLTLDFPLRDGDRDRAEALGRPLAGRRFALVHPASRWPSRHWPAERFAAVADALADAGLAIVLAGSREDAALTRAISLAMRAPCLDLAGRTDLWTLGALVEWAALVVCHDTGISQIAAALASPSVVVAGGSDSDRARWAPADAERHRVMRGQRPPGAGAPGHCRHDQGCACDVDAAEVTAAALEQAQQAQQSHQAARPGESRAAASPTGDPQRAAAPAQRQHPTAPVQPVWRQWPLRPLPPAGGACAAGAGSRAA